MYCDRRLLITLLTALFLFTALYSGCKKDETTEPLPPRTKTRAEAIPDSAVKMTPTTDLFPPILHSNEWDEPVPLGSGVNTAGGEDGAFVTPDGDELYFFFTPNVRVPVEQQLFDSVSGIWLSRKVNGQWTDAERVVLSSGGLALDGAPFVKGDTMWFASAREGYAGVNLFTARFRDGRWQDWRYVGDTLMKLYNGGEMHITSDGRELYFHSDRSGGHGGSDVWVSRFESGT